MKICSSVAYAMAQLAFSKQLTEFISFLSFLGFALTVITKQ